MFLRFLYISLVEFDGFDPGNGRPLLNAWLRSVQSGLDPLYSKAHEQIWQFIQKAKLWKFDQSWLMVAHPPESCSQTGVRTKPPDIIYHFFFLEIKQLITLNIRIGWLLYLHCVLNPILHCSLYMCSSVQVGGDSIVGCQFVCDGVCLVIHRISGFFD